MKALLSIDQAQCSGYAVGLLHDAPAYRSFELIGSGVVKKCVERSTVLNQAIALAGLDVDELVVILEDHSDFYFGRGNASVASLLGMGAARGRWEEQLDIQGHPLKHRYKATPGEWRKAVLGLPRNATAERAKAESVRYAMAFDQTREFSPDAAEALCMAVYCAGTLLTRAASTKAPSKRKARVAT